MNDFGKIVNFNGIFYHPYFCVNKQNIENMNPKQCASVKSSSQYSNGSRLQSKIIPVTGVILSGTCTFFGKLWFWTAISTILICTRYRRMRMIWIWILVRRTLQDLNLLTHLDWKNIFAWPRIYLDLSAQNCLDFVFFLFLVTFPGNSQNHGFPIESVSYTHLTLPTKRIV